MAPKQRVTCQEDALFGAADEALSEVVSRKKVAVTMDTNPKPTMKVQMQPKPQVETAMSTERIKDAEARAFWEDNFASSPQVRWELMAGALKVEYPNVMRQLGHGAGIVRESMDMDRDGQICMMEFNIFTRKRGLVAALEQCIAEEVAQVAGADHPGPASQSAFGGGTFAGSGQAFVGVEVGSACAAPGGSVAMGTVAGGAGKGAGSGVSGESDVKGVFVSSRERGVELPQRSSILFLGANNTDSAKLDLERELQQVEGKFKGGFGERGWSEHLRFHFFLYSSMKMVIEEVQSKGPSMLHFACHGQPGGLELFREEASGRELARVLATLGTVPEVSVRWDRAVAGAERGLCDRARGARGGPAGDRVLRGALLQPRPAQRPPHQLRARPLRLRRPPLPAPCAPRPAQLPLQPPHQPRPGRRSAAQRGARAPAPAR
eukprot:2799884-Rhodomonas_salina.1